jgi:outer membrane protein assembly factor BamD
MRSYRLVARNYPQSSAAPEALHRRGLLFLKQRRYQRAFHCFQSILDKYPDYGAYVAVVDLEFQTAKALMDGKRSYLFWGTVPGFRDRTAAIEYFRKIIERVPYGDCAPEALMNIAKLGTRAGDATVAVEALERLVDEYGNSPIAPDGLLMLADVYRKRVPGAQYDQKATREAINCYQEFLILFPDSPRLHEAEEGLAEATALWVRGKLGMGDFYYDARQNTKGAKLYYDEVLRLAEEDSPMAQMAAKRIEDIRKGKPGKGSPLDIILGRYRPPAAQLPRVGQ